MAVHGSEDSFPLLFEKTISGLDPNATYYVMAYAKSYTSQKTAYGQVLSATLGTPPSGGATVPKTGDNNPMPLLLLAMTAASGIVLLRKTKEETN